MSMQCPAVDGLEIVLNLTTNVWTVFAKVNWYNTFGSARQTAMVVNDSTLRNNGKSIWAAQTTGVLTVSGDVGVAATGSAVNLNQWYGVAIVQDGSNCFGYLDGAQNITQTFDSLAKLGVVDVGGAGSAGSSGIQVDFYKVWSAALTGAELLREGQQISPIRRRDLVLWGHTQTDDAVAQFARDRSGKSNDLTQIGTPVVAYNHSSLPWEMPVPGPTLESLLGKTGPVAATHRRILWTDFFRSGS